MHQVRDQLLLSMSSVESSASITQHTRSGPPIQAEEESDVEIDTECLLLLGILFCKDRFNSKAEVFYSIVKSTPFAGNILSSNSMTTTINLTLGRMVD